MTIIVDELLKLSEFTRISATDQRDFAKYAATWTAMDHATQKRVLLSVLSRMGAYFEKEAQQMDAGEPDADPFMIEEQTCDLNFASWNEGILDPTCARNAWCNHPCYCNTH